MSLDMEQTELKWMNDAEHLESLKSINADYVLYEPDGITESFTEKYINQTTE